MTQVTLMSFLSSSTVEPSSAGMSPSLALLFSVLLSNDAFTNNRKDFNVRTGILKRSIKMREE
jgi:hypothetical protein